MLLKIIFLLISLIVVLSVFSAPTKEKVFMQPFDKNFSYSLKNRIIHFRIIHTL